MPVRQVACNVPGCSTGGLLPSGAETVGPYLTDYDCETRAERVADLRDHVKDVHEFAENKSWSDAKDELEKNKINSFVQGRDRAAGSPEASR